MNVSTLFICMAIQDIGMTASGMKPVIPPETVWKTFKPDDAVPEIDFKANLMLFARNAQFFNRISIGKVNVKNGVAEVLVMKTMSAMPIEDKVAMSLVKVARQGITAIQSGNEIISINKKR